MGRIVHVTGSLYPAPTRLGFSQFKFRLTLPVPSVFTSAYDVSGDGSAWDCSGETSTLNRSLVRILADVDENEVIMDVFKFTEPLSSQYFMIQYSYQYLIRE